MLLPATTPGAAAGAEPALAWTELFHLISMCARRLRAMLAEHAAAHDLSELQFSLLWCCRQAPAAGISQRELVEAIEVSPAHVSNLVEQLRQKQLLAGDRSTVDRRRQVWRVTEAGECLLKEIMHELQVWAASLERELGTAQRQALARLLEELGAAVHPCAAPFSVAAASVGSQPAAREVA